MIIEHATVGSVFLGIQGILSHYYYGETLVAASSDVEQHWQIMWCRHGASEIGCVYFIAFGPRY
jgi:hypothetical protein